MFAFTVPAFAEKSDIDRSILDSINRTLNFIEPEKELYGLEDVDFTALSVGAPIMVYEYSDDDVLPLDICIYPLIYNESLVALAFLQPTENIVNIITNMVDEIAKHVSPYDDFALIYDNIGCYLYIYAGYTYKLSSEYTA